MRYTGRMYVFHQDLAKVILGNCARFSEPVIITMKERGDMKYSIKSALLPLAGLYIMAMTPLWAEAQVSGEFDLAGYHMTDPVGTSAVGLVQATVEGDSLIISGHFEDLTSRYWSAYIHYGAPGEKGNRLLKLHADVSDNHRAGRFQPLENAFKISEAVRQALTEGKLYLLVSSERYRQGEIRGQLPVL